MKKRWTALIALVSLGLGVAVASWYWLDFHGKLITHGLAAGAGANIVTKVTVLELIRAGRVSDATYLLEISLDGDLIEAVALAKEGAQFDANSLRAVKLEHQARLASGYEPKNQNVRNSVQEAFRLLPSTSVGTAAQPTAPRDAPQAARP